MVYLPALIGLRHKPSLFKQSGLYPNEPLENLLKSEQHKWPTSFKGHQRITRSDPAIGLTFDWQITPSSNKSECKKSSNKTVQSSTENEQKQSFGLSSLNMKTAFVFLFEQNIDSHFFAFWKFAHNTTQTIYSFS